MTFCFATLQDGIIQVIRYTKNPPKVFALRGFLLLMIFLLINFVACYCLQNSVADNPKTDIVVLVRRRGDGSTIGNRDVRRSVEPTATASETVRSI